MFMVNKDYQYNSSALNGSL